MTIVKKRNWACIVYPESSPNNWRDIIQETGLLCAISPLHDKDIDPTGEPKKQHYHVILVYEGPTTYNNVKSLTERINATVPQPLEQIRGYYRYFIHLDNPDKFQYDVKDITTINGFDINNYVDLTYTEIDNILYEIQHLVEEYNILEYCDLLEYLSSNDKREMWSVARQHTLFLNSYIKSKKYKFQEQAKKILPIMGVNRTKTK